MAQTGNYHMAVTVRVGLMSRQSEYFLFRAKQKFPVLTQTKSFLSSSYGEGRVDVSSMDGPLEGCIFPFSSLVHPLAFSPSLSQ